MKGFVQHIILNNGNTEQSLENKKELFDSREDDGNVKYEMKRIDNTTLEYKFYATKNQIDISGYAFWVDCEDNNADISIYINGREVVEYYTRKTLLDGKLFIEIFADVPTKSRKELKVVIKKTNKQKLEVLEVYRRLAVFHNRYMFLENK